MSEKLLNISNSIIIKSFYLIFFLIPLILTPYNYELFEYNKMMLTYMFTVIITTAWISKMILNRKIEITRTPLDLPLLLILLSQGVSTVFSIDRHVSLFGYYSRFNGGLFSTISYILLYYAFITNFPKVKLKALLNTALASGLLVSIYGILEHFGIDKNIWIQDVQNRVFSTLGQPNWLAAYLAVLIPVTIAFVIPNKSEGRVEAPPSGGIPLRREILRDSSTSGRTVWYIHSLGITFFLYLIIGSIFYLTLLYTKSRSGFLGFWVADLVFWVILFWKLKKSILTSFFIVHCSLFIITFLIATPYQQLNRFTYSELFKSNQSSTAIATAGEAKPYGSSLIDVGITESGVLRRIVWKGALDIFKAHPLFGTGVETFAFSYYIYRPVEHNMTSEWDFLYNKAHNEYLNYAANSGIFGIGSHLFIIGSFIIWNVNKFRDQKSKIKTTPQSSKTKIDSHPEQVLRSKVWIPDQVRNDNLTIIALFCSWISILITNFFGFSVVIIQLFFFLIPAISFVLANNNSKSPQAVSIVNGQKSIVQYILFIILSLLSIYLLYTLTRFWVADVIFATGYHALRNQEYAQSYASLKSAILMRDDEPLYYDEFSFPAAQLSVAFSEDEKEATTAHYLKDEAVIASTKAISLSPNNVNFWKTRTRVFYALSAIDEKYLKDAQYALEKAKELSPTDPKILYNLALIYDKFEKKDEAIKLLEIAATLKPDYRDTFLALGLFYRRDKNIEKAKEAFVHIIQRINPNDEDAKKQLEEMK